jgi:hypothetical protein
MAGKDPAQAMGDGRHKGDPGGTGVPTDERGAGGGGPIGPKKKDKPFRGGQSEAAYHGTGQLGEQPVEGGENPNAPRRES